MPHRRGAYITDGLFSLGVLPPLLLLDSWYQRLRPFFSFSSFVIKFPTFSQHLAHLPGGGCGGGRVLRPRPLTPPRILTNLLEMWSTVV